MSCLQYVVVSATNLYRFVKNEHNAVRARQAHKDVVTFSIMDYNINAPQQQHPRITCIKPPTLEERTKMDSGNSPIPRGLAHARMTRDRAREEYKQRRLQELEGTGQVRKCKKNDTSLTAMEKYRRRLVKNQESSAASRHAHDAYVENLELQVRAYDIEMSDKERELTRVVMERDESARLNTALTNHSHMLQLEISRIRALTGTSSESASNQSVIVSHCEEQPSSSTIENGDFLDELSRAELDFSIPHTEF